MGVKAAPDPQQKQTIEIGIIGGPFDRVTTFLQEFEPGQKDFIVNPETFGVPAREVNQVVEREVEVTVPARLHASVLDMNRFNTNRPGGGGIGFAVGIYFRARVRSTKSPEIIVRGQRPLIVKHFASVFKEILGFPGGFEIELTDHGRRHIGMGSSTGTMTAACLGINAVLGRPYDERELRRVLGFNACEESPLNSSYLMRGFETGIGTMAGVNGGMVLSSDDLELIHRVPLPDTRAVIIVPDVPSLEDEFTGKDTAAQSEVELLMRRARHLDSLQAGVKSQIILLDLLPAMVRGDLKGIGDAIFDLSFLGSKRAECEQHGMFGAPIYRLVSCLKEIGADVAGMSSVGPTIFALTRSSEVHRRVMKFLAAEKVPENRIMDTFIDNTGARIVEQGEERTVRHEAQLSG